MLVLEEVAKSYGDFQAVKTVSFSARKGEILGLLGPNGAGKTSIMRIITGYHFPSSGRVRLDNDEILADSPEVKNRIGYLPENAPLYPEFSVAEYLRFCAEARIPGPGNRGKAVSRVVKDCSLEAVYHRSVAELSKGFRQRVALAQALLHDPDILILDEPTSGLDPNQIQDIRKLIRNLGKEKTVILSTHIMQEAEALCDRVLILSRGVVVAQGDVKSIGRELRGRRTLYVRFNVFNDNISRELSSTSGISSLVAQDEGYELVIDSEVNPDFIFDWCVERGFKVRELRPIRESLEEVFNKLTRSDYPSRGGDGNDPE